MTGPLEDMTASQRVGLVAELDSPDHPHLGWSREQIEAARAAEGIDVAGLHFILTWSPQPAAELAEFREKFDVHFLAMPTHGRRGGPRIQFGSVAERLVRLSDGPTLVVR